MSTLFQGPERLPNLPSKVPSFRATRFESMSSRDAKYQAAFTKRVKSSAKAFRMAGDPVSEGERLVVRSGTATLEVYGASDSVWWTDHALAYRERPAGKRLPLSADDARALADERLREAGLASEQASICSVGFVEALIATVGARPRTSKTGIDVNYGFSLADYPVFGPGAKAKVTLAGGGQVAQVLRFWRQPRGAGSVAIMTPQAALERFEREPSFRPLRTRVLSSRSPACSSATTRCRRATSSGSTCPVYAVDASVTTPELPLYELRRLRRGGKTYRRKQQRRQTRSPIPRRVACSDGERSGAVTRTRRRLHRQAARIAMVGPSGSSLASDVDDDLPRDCALGDRPEAVLDDRTQRDYAVDDRSSEVPAGEHRERPAVGRCRRRERCSV